MNILFLPFAPAHLLPNSCYADYGWKPVKQCCMLQPEVSKLQEMGCFGWVKMEVISVNWEVNFFVLLELVVCSCEVPLIKDWWWLSSLKCFYHDRKLPATRSSEFVLQIPLLTLTVPSLAAAHLCQSSYCADTGWNPMTQWPSCLFPQSAGPEASKL